jgi:hypothetical protein
VKYILLTQGKKTIVDDEDFEWLSQWKWQYRISSNGKYKYQGYAYRNAKCIRMHREIIHAPKGIDVDHINGDTLDNRKDNLRLVNNFQQNQNSAKRRDNTSGCRGVNFFKRLNKWIVRIQVNNKRLFLGYFNNKEDAVKVYIKASKKYFKEYARLDA